MVDLGQRDYSQFEVQRDARAILADYPDLRGAVQDVAAISSSAFRQVDIDLNVIGPDMDKLQDYSERVARWMRQRGGDVDVDTSLSLRKPELPFHPKRERLSDLGVSVQTISTAAHLLGGGDPAKP